MTSETKELMSVTNNGAVLVNSASIFRQADGIVLIDVDLRSKYAECSSVGYGTGSAPTVFLSANKDTLHVDTNEHRDSMTVVEFPMFYGWQIYAADGPSRYTLRVVLVKEEE